LQPAASTFLTTFALILCAAAVTTVVFHRLRQPVILGYLLAGLLMWWPLLQDVPRRLASGARSAYAFAAFVLASPLGLLLALLPKPVYAFYEHAQPRVFDLSPLADQEIAGVTMASEQAVILFVVFLYWFRRFLAEEGG